MVLSDETKGVDVRESIVKKAYYSIGEVCDLTGLKPHVLRYWETQFDILRPTKNRAGNRVFKPKDIELVLLVKNLLYVQKYTIQGANQKLLDMRKDGELEGGQHEVLGPEFLASMKVELEGLAKVMDPSVPFEDLPVAVDDESGEEDEEASEVEEGKAERVEVESQEAGDSEKSVPEGGNGHTIELFEDPE
jgi:DNA-binding transcriptional MerR regulator